MSELTEDQKKQCTDVFNFLDKGKKGSLSPKEVEYALGVLGKKLRLKEYQEIEKEGKIDLDKFLDICLDKVDFNQTEQSMVDSFKLLESKDKPGFIKKKDLIFILKSYNEKITDKDINDIIKEANPDKDGNIDITAFAKEMLVK